MPTLTILVLLLVLLFFAGPDGKKLLRKMRERRATRRLAELTSLQAVIREVESGLPLLAKNARSTENATDCGSDPWRVRTSNRVAEVKSDQALLRDLKAREKELIKLLNKDG